MLATIELCLDFVFYYTGLVWLARWWNRRAGKRLVILCYHRMDTGWNVDRCYLREQLRYLRRHYRILPLEAALEELYAPPEKTAGARDTRDHRTMLALTFDDGSRDNYTHGLPLLNEEQVPVTIFLIPGYVENQQPYWWEEPRIAQHLSGELTVEGTTYQLDRTEDRAALMGWIDHRVRFASSVPEREAFIADMRQLLSPHIQPAEDGSPRSYDDVAKAWTHSLTWDEASEMEQSEWISFGAHTMLHPKLGYLREPAEVRYEIAQSRSELENHLGHRVRTFAYPVGKPDDMRGQTITEVGRAGFAWAFTTVHGVNTPQTDPLQVHRIMTDVEQPWLLTAAKASGLWDTVTALPRRALRPFTKWMGGNA